MDDYRSSSSLSPQFAGKQAIINLWLAEHLHSAVQKIGLISFMVNLRRSKGQARARSLLIYSTHLRQSMWPHGKNISTSLPFSVQLPQVIFGFLILNHIIACVWCYIGKESGDGWFLQSRARQCTCACIIGWCCMYWVACQRDFDYWYHMVEWYPLC